MLRNFEVIKKLNAKYGTKITSSQQLNKIMSALGLIVKNGNVWTQTEKGMKFSPYRTNVYPANEWLEEIVDFIGKNITK